MPALHLDSLETIQMEFKSSCIPIRPIHQAVSVAKKIH